MQLQINIIGVRKDIHTCKATEGRTEGMKLMMDPSVSKRLDPSERIRTIQSYSLLWAQTYNKALFRRAVHHFVRMKFFSGIKLEFCPNFHISFCVVVELTPHNDKRFLPWNKGTIKFWATLSCPTMRQFGRVKFGSLIPGNQRPHCWFYGLGHFHRWLVWQAKALIRFSICAVWSESLLVSSARLLKSTWFGPNLIAW